MSIKPRHSGRAKRDPESRSDKFVACLWVPGSSLTRRPGMTKFGQMGERQNRETANLVSEKGALVRIQLCPPRRRGPWVKMPDCRSGEAGSSPAGAATLTKHRRLQWPATVIRSISRAFEPSSKRRKGYPSETRVKRGDRTVRGRCRTDRKARAQRPMPVQFAEVVSSAAA